MNKWWETLIANLFKVKSLVTIMLTGTFIAMSLRGNVEPKDFYSIIVMVLTFYFGYQSAKSEDGIGGKGDENGTEN